MAANIVLADAQATPVNHTFVPVGRDNKGVYWFEDQSAVNAIGNWRISVDVKRPPVAAAGQNSQGRSFRIAVGLHEPILESVSNDTVSGIAPAPTISYVGRAFTEYVLPERSSLQNRKDLRKMNYNLQADTQLIAAVESLLYID